MDTTWFGEYGTEYPASGKTVSLQDNDKADGYYKTIGLLYRRQLKQIISGCGLTLSSAHEGRSGNIRVNMINKLFEPRRRACIS